MKKILILITGILAICGLSSCKESDEVDHISFEANNKTIELDKSMSGKEVFDKLVPLFSTTEEYTYTITPRYDKAYQRVNSTKSVKKYVNYKLPYTEILNGDSEETFKDTYTDYSPAYEQSEDSNTKHIELKKYYGIKNGKKLDEDTRYIVYYGTQTTLKENQMGYQYGNLERHFKEVCYYSSNMYDFWNEDKTETYTKYFNSDKDMINYDYERPGFSTVGSSIVSNAISFVPTMYFLDDYNSQLADYVHYSFVLTNKIIRLQYRLDFDLIHARNILMLGLSQIQIDAINEAKKKGNSYTVEVELEYKSIEDNHLFASKISFENHLYEKEEGVYGNDVADSSLVGKKYSAYKETIATQSYLQLSLSDDEIYKLRDEFISEVKKFPNNVL